MTNTISALIQKLPKYEQRHAIGAVAHAAAGNMNALQAAARSAATDKIEEIYLQIISAI